MYILVLCIRTWGIHKEMSVRGREKPGVTTYFVSPLCYYSLQAFILHGPSKGRGLGYAGYATELDVLHRYVR